MIEYLADCSSEPQYGHKRCLVESPSESIARLTRERDEALKRAEEAERVLKVTRDDNGHYFNTVEEAIHLLPDLPEYALEKLREVYNDTGLLPELRETK